MNKPLLLSAGAMLAAGLALLTWQGTRLAKLRSRIPESPAGPTPHAAAKEPLPRPLSRPAKRPAPEGKLFDRLTARLLESLDPEQVAIFLEAGDQAELGRMGIVAGLTQDERSAFAVKYGEFRRAQAALLRRKDTTEAEWAAIAEEKDAWTAAQLGADRMARVAEARRVSERALTEFKAAQLVSRISRAADLSTGQKDELYAALLERARNPPAASAPDSRSLTFQFTGAMSEEPGKPDISEEAKALVTPKQWEVFQQNRDLNIRQHQATTAAMMGMLPSAVTTLQELLEEETPAEGQKK